MRIRSFKGLIKPTSFNIIPSSISVKIGTTYEIPYTLLPGNAINQKINWSSSDTSIATVSNGIVTTVSVGTATITGTTDYLGFTDTVSINVYVVPVTGVSLNKSSITVNAGETYQLIATITPADAGDKRVTWSSSNTSVATVSSNGLVTYVGDGNATITVTTVDGGYTATCSVACVSFVPVDRCFSYTGGQQTITLEPHKYCIEVWGACGGYGNPSGNVGGKGGYSGGCITLTNSTTLYIYVGQQGGYNVTSTSFGGGGAAANSNCKSGQGGGASDIRIGGNTLYHRRIVAGGGAGGAGAGETVYCGGYGGGCTGGGAICNPSGCKDTVSGATQTCAGRSSSGCYIGSFGQGGVYTGGGTRGGGGGGGGWYGGGAGSWGTAGSGGSGYTYNSTTCSNAPSGYCHCTAYFLTNAVSCCGAVSFPSPSGGTETGHSGNGCVRIRSL